MANPRRVKMVAKQIQRELSDMLLTDKVLQFAVLPEASLGADRYLSSLTTITDVQVSADLQVLILFLSTLTAFSFQFSDLIGRLGLNICRLLRCMYLFLEMKEGRK